MRRNRWSELLPWALWAGVWAFHLATLHVFVRGLHHDEAYNALDALRVGRQGYWPVFLPENFGREPLMVYVMALVFHVLGPSEWSVRFPAALAWGLTYPSLYWLLRETYPDMPTAARRRQWWGITVVFLTSVWYTAAARMAIRTSWFVLLETLFMAALLRTWRTGSRGAAVGAGVCGGLLFYTYLPNRMIPLVLGFALALAVLSGRPLRHRLPLLGATVLVAGVIMTPLGVYFLAHPDAFGLRTSQVLVVKSDQPFQANVRALVQNSGRIAGMFFLRGDENQRSNVPGRPVLSPWGLPFLIAGVGYALVRASTRHLFLLGWFLIMLAPTWLTDNAPNFQRALGAFPPFVLLMGLGTDILWRSARSLICQPRKLGALAAVLPNVLVGGLLVGEAALSAHAFWAWQHQPYLFYAFDVGLSQVGRYLADLPPATQVYLTPRPVHHPTVQFYLKIDPASPQVKSFDGRSVVVVRPGETVMYIVITYEDFRFFVIAPWVWPGLTLKPRPIVTDPQGKVYAQAVTVPASARPRTPRFLTDALWEDHIRLIGYEPIGCCTYRPGDIIYLELWWTPTNAAPQDDWTVFTHLLDAEGRMVVGHDAEPGEGSYPTSVWSPDEWVIAEYPLMLPKDLPPGEYVLEVGLYDWRSGRRLPLSTGGDALRLTRVRVQE